jgi:hypothetical protein
VAYIETELSMSNIHDRVVEYGDTPLAKVDSDGSGLQQFNTDFD